MHTYTLHTLPSHQCILKPTNANWQWVGASYTHSELGSTDCNFAIVHVSEKPKPIGFPFANDIKCVILLEVGVFGYVQNCPRTSDAPQEEVWPSERLSSHRSQPEWEGSACETEIR